MVDDRRVFVLCHTLFHNTLRAGQYDSSADTEESLRDWIKAKFISDFIIEYRTEFVGDKLVACTTKKIYEDLSLKLDEDGILYGIYEYVEGLKSVIKPSINPKINSLNKNEGIIALADTLLNVYNKIPILITDMKEKKESVALNWYKSTGIDEPLIPFDIITPSEFITLIAKDYNEIVKLVLDRGDLYNCLIDEIKTVDDR